MTDSIAHSANGRPASSASERSLNYQETYTCPICRHGQLSALTLMDAFACNFCRHIFTANLQDQSVCVEDSTQKITWRWNGQTWQVGNQENAEVTWVIRLGSAALIALPPLIIWLPAYVFPPLEGSTLAWLPIAWVSLTFVTHLTLVSWLLAEHYQFPPYVSLKVRVGALLGRR